MSLFSTAAPSLRWNAHRCAVSPYPASDYPNHAAVSFNLHSFLFPFHPIHIETSIKDNYAKQVPSGRVESGSISRRATSCAISRAGFNGRWIGLSGPVRWSWLASSVEPDSSRSCLEFRPILTLTFQVKRGLESGECRVGERPFAIHPGQSALHSVPGSGALRQTAAGPLCAGRSRRDGVGLLRVGVPVGCQRTRPLAARSGGGDDRRGDARSALAVLVAAHRRAGFNGSCACGMLRDHPAPSGGSTAA